MLTYLALQAQNMNASILDTKERRSLILCRSLGSVSFRLPSVWTLEIVSCKTTSTALTKSSIVRSSVREAVFCGNDCLGCCGYFCCRHRCLPVCNRVKPTADEKAVEIKVFWASLSLEDVNWIWRHVDERNVALYDWARS